MKLRYCEWYQECRHYHSINTKQLYKVKTNTLLQTLMPWIILPHISKTLSFQLFFRFSICDSGLVIFQYTQAACILRYIDINGGENNLRCLHLMGYSREGKEFQYLQLIFYRVFLFLYKLSLIFREHAKLKLVISVLTRYFVRKQLSE